VPMENVHEPPYLIDQSCGRTETSTVHRFILVCKDE
jgi:hypothetical protein